MARKSSKPTVSKSDAIRDILRAQPTATVKEIKAALHERGFNVSDALVSKIKYDETSYDTRDKKTRGRHGGKSRTSKAELVRGIRSKLGQHDRQSSSFQERVVDFQDFGRLCGRRINEPQVWNSGDQIGGKTAESSISRRLIEALVEIDCPGVFCTTGSVAATLPGLEVDKLGPIGLPLTTRQAKDLKKHCDQATSSRA